ncbi:MAG: pyruvate kinase [Pseudomonadota bacterium]
MKTRILVTLGPSSFNTEIIRQLDNEIVDLFRINLSHTALAVLEEQITYVQSLTHIPICVDSEGSQIRNHAMQDGAVLFTQGSEVLIHNEEILGDESNISFSPIRVFNDFVVGDRIRIDFNSAALKVIELGPKQIKAIVETAGKVGSRKAVDLDRIIDLPAITPKDIQAIALSKELGVSNFALSFARSGKDVDMMRKLTGSKSTIISKIECRQALTNLVEIIKRSDELLIDRGDLSRELPLEKIPFLQRRIVSISKALGKPIHVATNLLESMVTSKEPTRAELNDVVSTLLSGADGLVLASETAIGAYPVECVKMIKKLGAVFWKWTENSSIDDIVSM